MITSLTNQKVKDIMRLKQKKYRDLEHKFLVETPHMVLEAYQNGCLLELYVLESSDMVLDVPTFVVSDAVMRKISSLGNSSVLGICKKKEDVKFFGSHFLLLDGIQDPGNLGTIIRTALGFGVDMVVLSEDACDLYNEKVVRATEGAIFHIPVIRMNLVEAICKMKEQHIVVYGTDVVSGVDVCDVSDPTSFALVMGNEGNGVSTAVKELVDCNLYIPIRSELESLNVGVATGILLYCLMH